jgi:hypothetical protein
MDFISIGQAAAAVVGPFLPYLVKLGKSVEKKLETVIEERGGDVVWNQAQKVWGYLSDWYSNDDEFISIAKFLAAAPEKADREEQFAQVVADRLAAAPAKAEDLTRELGGEKGVQVLSAGHRAKIFGFRQEAAAGANQRIQAGDDAEIRGGGQFQK